VDTEGVTRPSSPPRRSSIFVRKSVVPHDDGQKAGHGAGAPHDADAASEDFAHEGGPRLKRALGPVALTSLGIGAVIGSGIFVMTGRVAAQDAGPAVLLSFLVAGLACALAALCYAEFASMVPVAGSAYTYAYAALGEIFAWIIGWDLILEYAMAGACVASAWSHYLDEFLQVLFGFGVPEALSADPFSSEGASYFNAPALGIMAAVTWILVRGIRESATTNTVMVVVKVAVVLFVIGVGLRYVSPDNWFAIPVAERQIPENPAEKWGLLSTFAVDQALVRVDDAVRSPFMPYGLSGVMLGASILFFAYLGFDAVSTQAEEAKKPSRDIPLAILLSLVLCTALYLGVAAVITGMERYPSIDPVAAVASAFRKRGEATGDPLLRWSAALIATGALAGMTSVMLVTFLGQARIFFAMARDGLLPRSFFAALHPRFHTPHRSTILTGALCGLIAAFTPVTKLEEMVNIGTLMAFALVCVAVLVLRVRRPTARRPFRCPAVWVVAPAGIVVNVVMMLFLPVDTWLRLLVWLALGFVFYWSYGRKMSVLAHVEP
jgi:APA family basic amino acid/polyamine antiporter